MALVAKQGLSKLGLGICQHASLVKLHCHVVERIDALLAVSRLRAAEYVVAAGHVELPRFQRVAVAVDPRGQGSGPVQFCARNDAGA